MKNMKILCKVLPILLCLILTLVLTLTASAAAPRLIDGADLLTDGEESALLSKLDRISEAYGMDIVLITSQTMQGWDAAAYARQLFEENGYGDGVKASGVILFVSMADRDYAVVALGDAYDVFNETDMDALEDSFWEDLSDGYYSRAFHAYADQCEHTMKYDKRLTPIWIVISLIVGAVIAGIVVWNMTKKHKSVELQHAANTYMLRDTFRVDRSRDVFLYSHVTRRARPQNSSSGSRSSGGGGSRSRSGKF